MPIKYQYVGKSQHYGVHDKNSVDFYNAGLSKSFQPWKAVPAFQPFQIAWPPDTTFIRRV